MDLFIMKNILLGIFTISLAFILLNLPLRSVDPVHAATPKNLPARTLTPPVNDISTNMRPPRVIATISDEGGYSDYDHMKCLEQALLEPRGQKRNDARKNCNQSSQ